MTIFFVLTLGGLCFVNCAVALTTWNSTTFTDTRYPWTTSMSCCAVGDDVDCLASFSGILTGVFDGNSYSGHWFDPVQSLDAVDIARQHGTFNLTLTEGGFSGHFQYSSGDEKIQWVETATDTTTQLIPKIDCAMPDRAERFSLVGSWRTPDDPRYPDRYQEIVVCDSPEYAHYEGSTSKAVPFQGEIFSQRALDNSVLFGNWSLSNSQSFGPYLMRAVSENEYMGFSWYTSNRDAPEFGGREYALRVSNVCGETAAPTSTARSRSALVTLALIT